MKSSGTGLDMKSSGTGLDMKSSGTGLDMKSSGTGLDMKSSGTGLDPKSIGCVDVLLLPARADSSAAVVLARALHPAVLIVPKPYGKGSAATVTVPPIPGVVLWRDGPGRELRLSDIHPRCSTRADFLNS
jgi:hypothetical protein